VLKAISIASFFASLVLLSFAFGRFVAFTQTDYYVLDGDPEMVILYMTGDRLIATTADRANKIAGDSLSVIFLEDLGDRTITLEEIGPLIPTSRVQQVPSPIPDPTLTPISTTVTPPPP
jgi:hypothetical protein